MIKEIICGHSPTARSGFIWNMLGSGMYAASSLLLTYLTIRMVGPDDGGTFAIGLTIAQLLANIVYYETRNYQVTDTEHRYGFADYHSVKIINSAVMTGLSFLFVAVRGYDSSKALIVVLVCVYRMLDGYADGYESQFHASGRLDLAGKSMTFRALLSLSVYFIVLHFTGSTLRSISAAIAAALIGILIFDIWIFDTVGRVSISRDTGRILAIIKDCFPLFAGMFLWTYLLSASRIAVDAVLDDSAQAYFQVLFMPVSVINLFATFILKPSLIELSEQYAERSTGFIRRSLVLMAEIAVFTIVCIAAAFFLGPPVLRLISGLDVSDHRAMFAFLILAGGVNAVVYLLYSLLLIFRWSRAITMTYLAASVLALLISRRMTVAWGLWGASASYMVTVSFVMIVFGILVTKESLRISKTDKEEIHEA